MEGENLMRILVSIDDTDNFTTKGIKGTGDLAKNIARAIKSNGWGNSSRITRHQLLLHEDIPYTSHNSSMCFEAEIDPQYLQAVIDFSVQHLETESEPEADPGLCVIIPDRLADPVRLIDYGYRAKREVLDKNDAYVLASELGIHLSEHGGTGQGVIGAMAGAGLRLGATTGRSKISIRSESREPFLLQPSFARSPGWMGSEALMEPFWAGMQRWSWEIW